MLFLAFTELMLRLMLAQPSVPLDCPHLIAACETDSECESLDDVCADFLKED